MLCLTCGNDFLLAPAVKVEIRRASFFETPGFR
jgi:hypothetical protein